MTQAPATPELVERLRERSASIWDIGNATIMQEAADALEAQQARIAELEAESAALTRALTGLTCSGSEFFIRKGDRYVADIDACVSWVRRTKEDAHRRTIKAITEQKASQALADRYEKALRPFAAAFDAFSYDEPIIDLDQYRAMHESVCLNDFRQASLALSSSQGRHEGEQDSSSRSQPCGVGPSDLTDPQSQHSDGVRDDA